MDQRKRAGIILTVVLVCIFVGGFFYNKYIKYTIENEGVRTIGITYSKKRVLQTVSLRYFYKVGEEVYTGTTDGRSVDGIGYYYVVKYSLSDPSESEIFLDSLIADSIGKAQITSKEIETSRVVNLEDWKNYE
jgi:hypothetical protein